MTTMGRTLRVLQVEDSEQDMALIDRHLKQAGYDLITDRVETAQTMQTALESGEWDVILCDYSMPEFSALEALALVKQMKVDIPFIIISGTIGETAAVEVMRAGAHDYMMKDSLTRLVPAIEREMKEAENRRAMRAAEDQLRLQSVALESAANGIIITDEDGTIIWVNPAFTQASGYSLKQVVGKNPRMLQSGKQDRTFYKGMWDTILSGNVWRDTVINRRKDGTLFHEDLTITPILDSAGKITRFVGIQHDITARKMAEDAQRAAELRYRRLFENAKDGILILNADTGQIVDANPYSMEKLGYSYDELVGKELWEIGVLKDTSEAKRAFEELHQKGYLRYEELAVTTRGGPVTAVEFASHIYPVGDSKVIQCNIRDLSDRKRAEKALSESNHKLETTLAELSATTQQLWQASKLATMGELSASIAHELNNPLATVSLRVEALLTRLPENHRDRHALEVVMQEVDRMAALVNNLLQFSRRSHRQISTLDVCEEVGNSADFVQYHLRSRKVGVVFEFADSLPTIQADREQLRQLFLNLLTNASDAMPEGGTLTITATATYLEGSPAVQLEFVDTGEGISAENLEKIWEPFFTTKSEGKGTGLGLAICRRIVEQHGGTIALKSGIGHGTTARIVFPATGGGTATDSQ